MAGNSRKTSSGIEIPAVVTAADLPETDRTSLPGEYPFTRGIYPDMYRGRLWTMRQYAGYGTAQETNRRFKYLLTQGQTGLSVAFDLPTQIGYGSDHPLSRGEVGRTGVAIDSLLDMEALFEDIPLDQVSTSMTINATAVIILAMYVAVGRKQGVAPEKLAGTVQNDVLKEYVARGAYIYPPGPSMRLVTDLFEYADEHLPQYNVISVSGYHIREAGATAAQEVAFTLSNAVAYVNAALAAGMDIDRFARHLSFFFAAHSNLFEEVAKFRAARRVWARIMRERFGAGEARSMHMRFHAQTSGSTLTAQQPENNIVRTTLEALAAVLGGTQSLHTNSFDEALGLPTEKAAEIALRTQQILAWESGVADTVDPLAGSYCGEYLTTEMENRVTAIMAEVERRGGSVACIESGYFRDEIARAAWTAQKDVEAGTKTVVGVNRFRSESVSVPPVLKVNPALEEAQVAAVRRLRDTRDSSAVDKCLRSVRQAVRDGGSVVYPVIEAVEAFATVAEISDIFRSEWGEYHE